MAKRREEQNSKLDDVCHPAEEIAWLFRQDALTMASYSEQKLSLLLARSFSDDVTSKMERENIIHGASR